MPYLLKYSLPPLTQEEERELIKQAQSEQSDSAVDTLLRSNIKLIYKLAREFMPCNLSVDDLAAEGTTGLVYAIGKFDLDQETRFTTYACWWVRQKMRIAIQNQASTVRMPSSAIVSRAKLLHQKDELQEELGHEPSTEELAAYTGLEIAQVRHLLYSLGYDVRVAASEDDEAPDVEETLADFSVEGFLEGFDRREQREKLDKAWKKLSQRDRFILGLRFGLDGQPQKTLEEVAQEVGRCRERCRQLQDEALQHLKKEIEK